MKGPGKEANATRVISQPQMLDKSKEAESLLETIRKAEVIIWKRKVCLFLPR